MTQEELAKVLGVSRKTINMIESSRVIPKVDLAYKLSLLLDITVEELFHNEEYNNLCLKKKEESFKNIANIYFKNNKK